MLGPKAIYSNEKFKISSCNFHVDQDWIPRGADKGLGKNNRFVPAKREDIRLGSDVS
jgi:hypothetical protein